jgi:hypothetical protein
MAKSAARKPLPALAFLLALSLLTALVWWRVLHRADATDAVAAQPSCTPSVTVTALPAPQAVTLTVLNSTQRTGLAAMVGQELTQLGFKVAGVANDETSRAPVASVAEVRFGPAGTGAATLVSYYVPGAVLVNDGRTDTSVDLALGAKYTALATAAQVTKALAAAHLVQLPPPATKAASSSGKAAATSPSAAAKSSASTPASTSASATTSPTC